MHSQLKIIRSGDEITLLLQNGGRALAWLMLLEVMLLGGVMAGLAAVLPRAESLFVPGLASVVLVAWTWALIKPDVRITMNLASREGRVVRIAAFGMATRTF